MKKALYFRASQLTFTNSDKKNGATINFSTVNRSGKEKVATCYVSRCNCKQRKAESSMPQFS